MKIGSYSLSITMTTPIYLDMILLFIAVIVIKTRKEQDENDKEILKFTPPFLNGY